METSEQRNLYNRLLEPAVGGGSCFSSNPGMYLVIPVGDVSVSKSNRGEDLARRKNRFQKRKKKILVFSLPAPQIYEL